MEENKIQIFQTADGQVQLQVALEQETVWLSQAQMVALFGRNQSVISRHIRNALAEGEIAEKSNMQKMHIANSDSGTLLRFELLQKLHQFKQGQQTGQR